jgi:uncharacterized protein YehS (DUF1456 family)
MGYASHKSGKPHSIIQQGDSVTNNDILKKLRIALKLQDTDIIEILKLADFEVSNAELNALFRNSEHRNYKECGDQLLRRFLDGLIIKKRGPQKHRQGRIIKIR